MPSQHSKAHSPNFSYSKFQSFFILGKIPEINPHFFLFTMINIDRLIGILVPIWTQMWFRDLIFFSNQRWFCHQIYSGRLIAIFRNIFLKVRRFKNVHLDFLHAIAKCREKLIFETFKTYTVWRISKSWTLTKVLQKNDLIETNIF